MALENVAETPRATSLATNMQEFKAAKAAPAAVNTPKPEEKKEPSEPTGKPESGIAAAPEAPTQATQEQGKKDRSAEGRAAELSAQGRYDEARKILEAKDRKRDEEIAELRKKLEQPQAPSKPAAEPEKPKAPAVDPTKPNLRAMVADPKNKERLYDDVVDEWEQKTADWREGKRTAEAEKKASVTKFNEKMDAARKVYSDFDSVLSGNNYERTVMTLDREAIGTVAHLLENGMDVLYHLASEPDECRRIAALPPARQLMELGYIARDLKAEAKSDTPATPEKPKLPTPISRSTAPPRSLGGVAPGEPKNEVPTSVEHHKRLKAARAK